MKICALSARTLTLAAILAISAFSLSVNAKDWKSIAVATEGAYEPWNMTGPDGTLIGFEPDLIDNLCQRMKIECKLIAQDWDGMIAGLKLGKFDVIMDGIAVSAERRKEIAFTIPYANTPAAFVVAKKGPLANLPGTGQEVSLTGNAAADKPVLDAFRAAFKGKTIGIQAGTSFTSFIYDNFKDIAKIREYKSAPAHDLDLKTGRIDAVFDDVSYFISALSRPENQSLAFTGPKIGGPIWDIGEAFGLRHADGDLRAKFDEAIEAALTDGTVRKLSEKWFHGHDITPKK